MKEDNQMNNGKTSDKGMFVIIASALAIIMTSLYVFNEFKL